ncbi:AlpA family transcriptional regulator [Aquitalea pelogenes]|uniref:AlpA family transcriptional regulator n=1 Tax=Aquitalea pelogenes TaxID=1293573 RepID=UPI0035ADB57E
MKFLRLKDVLEKTGLSRSTLYQLMSDSAFPQSVSLGERCVGWVESEIDDWMLAKIEERDLSHA